MANKWLKIESRFRGKLLYIPKSYYTEGDGIFFSKHRKKCIYIGFANLSNFIKKVHRKKSVSHDSLIFFCVILFDHNCKVKFKHKKSRNM